MSNCVNDTRDPRVSVRANYVSLYKWSESDAEFIKSVRRVAVHGLHRHPRVVDSISSRQLYMRSCTFSRKESTPEKAKTFLGRPGKVSLVWIYSISASKHHKEGNGMHLVVVILISALASIVFVVGVGYSISASKHHKEGNGMHFVVVILVSALASIVFVVGVAAAYKYGKRRRGSKIKLGNHPGKENQTQMVDKDSIWLLAIEGNLHVLQGKSKLSEKRSRTIFCDECLCILEVGFRERKLVVWEAGTNLIGDCPI
ncbi:hypothetical protein SADUNF_Sadunf16G0087900 [Salix dunnii]|uniref:Uncharacterized protein n=1 Tax=Salix dunnii TaxID=1413687 RepID=A0A835MPQ9_9ROSI|nr:hypothetical protein SADUNF_Sadunf16G0087900 [Salix dunnii]